MRDHYERDGRRGSAAPEGRAGREPGARHRRPRAGFGPVSLQDDGLPFEHDWEARVYALNGVLRARGLYTTDGFRDAIEPVPPQEYLGLTYYERWLRAIETLLEEKDLAARPGGRVTLAPGTRVRARLGDPDHHTRLPAVRARADRRSGRGGRAVAAADDRAQGVVPPRVETVYSVRFPAAVLWGAGGHSVVVDLWESYLEEAG